MQFLLDVNIPPSLGVRLASLGHSYRWVPLCMDPSTSDLLIIQEAIDSNEVILTHDTDFGTLLSFFGSSKPSVILFRIDKVNAEIFFNLLTVNWLILGTPLTEGALIIIEADKLRIRKLPIRR
jgi:predicted nuclease of predicted toxin-antitoxin system